MAWGAQRYSYAGFHACSRGLQVYRLSGHPCRKTPKADIVFTMTSGINKNYHFRSGSGGVTVWL